jgi:hypothetical protein
MHLSLEVLLTVGADEEVSLTETERIRLQIYKIVFLVFYSFCKYKNVYISRFCSLPRRRRKSRLLYSSVYNRCDGNGKFSYMRDRGVKETMSQWIYLTTVYFSFFQLTIFG